MLRLSNTLTNIQVMSLRTSNSIGSATEMIINPNNLRVEGWYVQDSYTGRKLVLVRSEVRDFSPQGIIVNDHEVLVESEELVRLKPIIRLRFQLIGKQVISQGGKKYGKVSDFAIETESLFVKKIYASQSILKSFTGGSLSIDRTQIVEVTKNQIVIEDATEKASEAAPATSPINS